MALQRIWDRGDAALPVDLRLPPPARRSLLEAMAPASLLDVDGEQPLGGGRPVEPGDALVVATSGTTGEPKGVVLTHDAVVASATATSTRLGVTRRRPLAGVPAPGPRRRPLRRDPGHGHGHAAHRAPGFDAARSRPRPRPAPPSSPSCATALARVDPARFRVIVLGGARPPADLPGNVVTTYGLTETGSGVVYDGRPLDGVDVRLADDGEVHLRGPMLLRAYRDGGDPKDADGWLPTGDLGALDGAGRLVVHGRRGDLVITGGENVWPEAVESALAEHPDVAEVVVAGRPDPEWGQRVVAFVVPVSNRTPPDLDGLRAWVKERLPAFCAPRELALVERIPRTALGKPRRDLLVAGAD